MYESERKNGCMNGRAEGAGGGKKALPFPQPK